MQANGALPADSVDRLLADWHRARPELDFSPVGIVARLARIRARMDAELADMFAQHGLSGPAFSVLVTLARLDRPDGVPQRLLTEELGLTSGTVSVRMDRLEAQGLVARRPDPGDGRLSRIVLTEQGRRLFERVAPAHLDNERRMLVALDAGELAALAGLLRKLLVEYEGSLPPPGARAGLGLTLAPAHVAIAMRRAVGLRPAVGLLVRAVAEGGPAHGVLQPGDVLERAGEHALTSIGALHAALSAAGTDGRLELHVLRGADALEVRLPLREATGRPPGLERRAADQHVV